ncbi:fungal protein [Ophiostoma piceae UAMH 11346]|uniref:Fungal protein n=1 Tax=Ophiostoma piceae (strain UAMH 11346) TaxID=1262450 RepID=S3C4Q4_OPHP1|nr:fungal protein [Ophiostoma piceae UAMH 11346]
MGLFSRKDKSSPKTGSNPAKVVTASHSTGSLNSGSSLRSPISPSSSFIHNSAYQQQYGFIPRTLNRSSAGTSKSTATSMSSPGSPVHLPKVDIPGPPDPALDPAGYLRSLPAVRERSRIVSDKALRDELAHFDVDMSKFPDIVSFVAQIIRRDYEAPYAPSIPPHGRYQHFAVGGRDRVALLLTTFPPEIDSTERCRRLIDLFLVSVLLDAGAGTEWQFKSTENGKYYKRSEGLAVASLEMFKAGVFSGQPNTNKTQVDKDGLRALTVDVLAKGLQHGPGNNVAGLEGRANLLIRLGDALASNTEFFGPEGRPGNMVDYLLAHPTTQASSMPIVLLPVLWSLLMDGLAPIWPASRTAINGTSLGDAWPCTDMPQQADVSSSPKRKSSTPTFSPFPNAASSSPTAVAAWESIVPFHKLTQWLTYSLMQPMQTLLKIHFAGTELLTGLPEYRNGGLFVDLGVLTLKKADSDRGLEHYRAYCERTGTQNVEVAPMFEPSDDVIVEWRAVTVGFLDKLSAEVNKYLAADLQGHELSLPQILEAGSWKGGREIAEMSRPNTKEPPILIDSDGTVF